jgi:hypothetical protein
MTQSKPLIDEAILELRAYMFQELTYSILPISLLRVEEILLSLKQISEDVKLPLITEDDSIPVLSSMVKDTIVNINKVMS